MLKIKAKICAYFTDFGEVREQFHMYGDPSRCHCLYTCAYFTVTGPAMLKIKAKNCAYFTDFWQVSEPGNSRAGVDFLKHVFINQHTKELLSARNT